MDTSGKIVNVGGESFLYQLQEKSDVKHSARVDVFYLKEVEVEEKRIRTKSIPVDRMETRINEESGLPEEINITRMEDREEKYIEVVKQSKPLHIGGFDIYTRMSPVQVKTSVIGFITEQLLKEQARKKAKGSSEEKKSPPVETKKKAPAKKAAATKSDKPKRQAGRTRKK